MSGDLRAAVEGLLERPTGNQHYNRGWFNAVEAVLALIPEGAVLVTEAELATALEAHWPREMAPHPGARACAPDILRHLREAT